MLASFKDLPVERVQVVPIYWRYTYKRYIFRYIADILLICCRYVLDVSPCSFKRIWYVLYISEWGALEYLMVLIKQTLHPKCNPIVFAVWYSLVINSTMHCNEVLHACRVDPIYCDIFGPAERVLIYGQPINLRYIHKRVPALLPTLFQHFG